MNLLVHLDEVLDIKHLSFEFLYYVKAQHYEDILACFVNFMIIINYYQYVARFLFHRVIKNKHYSITIVTYAENVSDAHHLP